MSIYSSLLLSLLICANASVGAESPYTIRFSAGHVALSQWDAVDPALLLEAKRYAARRVIDIAPISTTGYSPTGAGSHASAMRKMVFRATFGGNEDALIPSLDALEGSDRVVHEVVAGRLWRMYESGVNEYLAAHRPATSSASPTTAPPPATSVIAPPPSAPSVGPEPVKPRIIPKKPLDSAGSRGQLD